MMKKINLTALLIFILLFSCGDENQNVENKLTTAYNLYKSGNIDSTLIIVHSLPIDELDDVHKKTLYNGLGELHSELGNMDSSYYYQNKSIFIKEQLNDKEGLALSYNDLAVYYLKINSIDLAIENLNKAIEINKQLENKSELTHNYMNLGYAFDDYHKYNIAISQYNKSLGLIENDTNHIKGDLYHNIAFAYSKINKKKKSIEYFNQSLNYRSDRLDSLITICANYNLNKIDNEKHIETFQEFKNLVLEKNYKEHIAYSYYYLSFADTVASRREKYLDSALYYFDKINNYEEQKHLLFSHLLANPNITTDKEKIQKLQSLIEIIDQRNYESDLLVLNSQKKALEDNYKLESEIKYQKTLTWFSIIIAVIIILFLAYIVYLIRKKKLSESVLSNIFYKTQELKTENINQLNNKIVELMFKIDDYAIIKDREGLEKNLDEIVNEANALVHKTNSIIDEKKY